MHPIIEQHREELEAACRKYGVTRLEVFGSAARDDIDESRSDLDFIGEFQRPGPMNASAQFFGFLFALEDLFCRGIDIVEMDCVTNPYLLKAINKDRTLIYDARSSEVPA
jgi:uncharacterized protein